MWRGGDGFDLEVVSGALVLGSVGWRGNVISILVMRAGPLQGT